MMLTHLDASSAVQDTTQNFTLLKTHAFQIVATIQHVKIGNNHNVQVAVNLSAVTIPIGNAPRRSNGNAQLNHLLVSQSAATLLTPHVKVWKECTVITGNQTAVTVVILMTNTMMILVIEG